MLGQRLSGNFAFEKTATEIRLKLGDPDVPTDKVSLNFGNGTSTFVSVKLRGELGLLAGGVAASFTASELAFPGLPTGTFQLSTGPCSSNGQTTSSVMVGSANVAPGVLVRVGEPGPSGTKASVSVLANRFPVSSSSSRPPRPLDEGRARLLQRGR